MRHTTPSAERPLAPVEPRDAAELITVALRLTRGRIRQADIAREANSAVADRLLDYFHQTGIVLMRPPPRIGHRGSDLGLNGHASAREP